MAVRAAKKRRNDQCLYRNAKGKYRSGVVLADQTAPGSPGISTNTSGGTLAAATYSYRITMTYAGGLESAPSVASTQVTTGATSTVTVDMTGKMRANATGFKVYGRTGGSELLMGTVTLPTLTFTDTGAATPSGALPTDTGQVNIKQFTGTPNLNSKNKTTTYKATDVYFKR